MMTTDRLFAVEATAHERGVRRRANLRAQGSMFDAPEAVAWSCPACGGDRERCTCATTGAQALALELDEPAALDERPAYPPPGGTPLTRTRDHYAAHSAENHRRADLAALVAIITDAAEGLRARATDDEARGLHDVWTEEAERYEHLAEWLTLNGWPNSDEPDAWPCPLCDTPIGDSCFPERTGHHCWRGWRIASTHPGDRQHDDDDPATETCWPTIEHGPAHAYRGRCLGCEWRGSIRDDENTAVEDAHDHTHPGWRELPAVPAPTFDKDQRKRSDWMTKVHALYPFGWLDQPAAPIVTKRRPMGTRHHPDHQLPGYSLGRLDDEPNKWPTTQAVLL